MTLTAQDLIVPNLGPRTILSPLGLSKVPGDGLGDFVPDETRVLDQIERRPAEASDQSLSFEKAGPREHLYFDPRRTKAALVTCGGLSPGLNNVIRSAFLELHHNYGVPEVLGIRFGYQGLNPARGQKPLRLTSDMVEDIHRTGGTILGSSRGPEDPGVIVDFLKREGINILFCVGGDGTQRGAHTIAAEVQRRGLPIAIVGIPKTIDNDLPFVWRSFGFGTALDKAREVIDCAHVEAKSAQNGVGLVKLMGREAGFIAATATLASQEVNFALIPEVPFPLEGEGGLLHALKKRLAARGHAVIVVAEGAGQDLIAKGRDERDASGNLKLNDIGLFLKERITRYFAAEKIPMSLKYIDPSYVIRSVPANTDDSLLCDAMARYAVHAAMAGKTDVLIGLWHNEFLHVPISAAVASQKRLSPEGGTWLSVLATTGQPRWGARLP
ncbi:MAG: ATP-dependent 6-phosphofructokinase [Thermoguttaceae bacterium]